MATDLDGTAKQKKRVVKNLGPLSRFDDGQPNFVKRLRQSFKDQQPIIPELKAIRVWQACYQANNASV
jgi:hypothetical protein